MTTSPTPKPWELLLTRRGTVYVPDEGASEPSLATGVALELAKLGFAPTSAVQGRLVRCSAATLATLREQWTDTLLRHVGGHVTHTPLFRNSPDGVPVDTEELWWKRVLVHFMQAPNQACIHCRQKGCTHVLRPCQHVVCEHCFDGSNYSGCPICNIKVDTSSPFFLPSPERPEPKERVRFKLLHLGEDLDADAQAYFESLCARPQALSPDDRDAMVCLLEHYGQRVLQWIPAKIPLRENIATIFATLYKADETVAVLEAARPHMTTATDVLRFIAVLSGTDGSLQAEVRLKPIELTEDTRPTWVRAMQKLGLVNVDQVPRTHIVHVPIAAKRFEVAKLRRATRRALLGMLEAFDAERLNEDLHRHRSFWIWVGEFLHPHEYAKRFPKVAAAFKVLRRKDPKGNRAPKFRSWSSHVERALQAGDGSELLAKLRERPGEFGRRLDHVLRQASDEAAAARDTFIELLPGLATPMLLTLLTHFERRHERQPVRVYWPKGKCAFGAAGPDRRELLPLELTRPLCEALEAELLGRFAKKSQFDLAIVDQALDQIIVPFNERTAARAAISLPRGSSVEVPDGKVNRLFLHWCQPEGDRSHTDLDLSVGFYYKDWSYFGPCSYYELTLSGAQGTVIAKSAGDFTSAPHPEGASEFIDIDDLAALDNNIRYAVMVVNAYSGLPFGALEDAFAGLMLREDMMGKHFDPRTVELKFDLQGENGIYMPVVFDLWERRLHWLDVSAKGQFVWNNVETSNKDIQRVVPNLLSYFGSGVRPTMFRLGVQHAAARAKEVVVRGEDLRRYERQDDESVTEFAKRILAGGGTSGQIATDGRSTLALLLRGDLELPEDAEAYALFREQAKVTLAASDLLA